MEAIFFTKMVSFINRRPEKKIEAILTSSEKCRPYMSGVFARNGTNDIFDFSILGTNYSQIWPWEMHSCSFKSSYGLSSIIRKNSFSLCNFDELFSREESACIF